MQQVMTRRAGLRAGGLVAVSGLALLAGCAGLGGPRTVEISEARLVELMGRSFPRSQRYLDLFDVTLSAPRVRLMPEQNRIGTELAYSLGTSVLSERQMTGTLGLSYALRLEPSDATVRLANVKVERFDLSGLPRAYAGRAHQLGALLADKLFEDLVVHRLDAADMRRLEGRGLKPGALSVVPGGLRLQLEAADSAPPKAQQVR
ncbi:hypothetical protein [Hydrogenophaga sp.]|uniref:hypothetical protein n=1 Tax=Hydrogenophaga sp. TaxID=1904254 RepID=UPI003D9AF7B5